MHADPQRAQHALTAYPFANPTLTPITMGNINETYVVHDGDTRYVLQRLNPIFDAHVHEDIHAITRHLLSRGLVTPTLVRTRTGSLWTTDAQQGVWRVLTFIDGHVFVHLDRATTAVHAGRLLGQFHHALSDLKHRFVATRLGVHDTPRHVRGLLDAVAQKTAHIAHAQVAPLAARIIAGLKTLPDLHGTTPRIVHGDPKISNIIFAPDNTARAFVDLDTLAEMPLGLELGDALRSWCNPGGEGQSDASFSLPFFEGALQGYAQGCAGLLTDDEIAVLSAALPTIALELAARFARDALEESYFGWDQTAYSAAWEHNLVRAQSQLALAESYFAQQAQAEAVVRAVFRL